MRHEVFSSETFLSVCVQWAGWSDDPAVARFGPARRNSTIVHYCTAGAGFYNGHSVHAGQGFIIRPGDWEEYHPDEKNPWTFFWLVISAPDPEQILRFYDENPETHVFDYDFVSDVRDMQRWLSAHSSARPQGLKNWTLLMRLLDLHLAHEKRAPSPAAGYAEYARSYIEYHASSRVTVNDVARKIGVSASYLYRIFTAAYGCSPRQFLNECRLRRARELLGAGESVAETARAAGYDDALEFSRFFKAHTGLSPSDYAAKKSGRGQ